MDHVSTLGAASFLGLGTVWAQGLSGSAALQMARTASMPPGLVAITGEIPLTSTIFRWESLACVAVEIAVVSAVMWLIAGSGKSGHLLVAPPGQRIVGDSVPAKERMIDMLKRHEIQALRRAGHTWMDVAAMGGVSVRTVRRVAGEAAVTATVDNAAERARRQVGRPSKAEAYRDVIERALTRDGTLRSVELLHRARLAGYTGSRSALYARWPRHCARAP